MTVAAAKTSTAVFSVFVVLLVTFILLSTRNWAAGHTELVKISGYLGVLTALPTWYASPAGVINDTHGKVVLPVGPRQTRARWLVTDSVPNSARPQGRGAVGVLVEFLGLRGHARSGPLRWSRECSCDRTTYEQQFFIRDDVGDQPSI
jgi:hypothetical protein